MSTAAAQFSNRSHTLKNLQCIASNLYLPTATSFGHRYISLINLPLRLVNDFFALRGGDYYKLALDVTAFAALFFPYGSSVAVAVDYLSELVQIYRQKGEVNFHTLKNAQCVLSNLAGKDGLLPSRYVYLANLPLRCCNDFLFLREGSYYKVALDVAAFVALFLPYGTSTAILIDYLAEIIAGNVKHDKKPRSPPDNRLAHLFPPDIRTITREGALQILWGKDFPLAIAEAHPELWLPLHDARFMQWEMRRTQESTLDGKELCRRWSQAVEAAYLVLI